MKLGGKLFNREHFRLAIAGSGAAGTALAAEFAHHVPKNQVALIDSTTTHYYQPGFTLLGGGLIPEGRLQKAREDTIPNGVRWLRADVGEFRLSANELTLSDGNIISYDFLVIATGLECRYDMVDGLEEALKQPDGRVCSIYRFDLAKQTFKSLQQFKGGTAIFTFPNTPIKCPGAPQKICYVAEEIFRNNFVRNETKMIFCNTLGVIFEVPKYAKTLMDQIESRNIDFRNRANLVAVDWRNRVATLERVDENRNPTGEKTNINVRLSKLSRRVQYDLLHVGPPCTPVEALRKAAKTGLDFVDKSGWVRVNEKTLQSSVQPNVFALGDCANTTNKKTAAAVAAQLRTLRTNLRMAMLGKELSGVEYNGYASCPLVVDSHRVIMAEFDHKGPRETFLFDQSIPRRFSFWITRYFLPWLYWGPHLKGKWNGPETFRRLFRFGRVSD